MAYTEVKLQNAHHNYYRVRSIREGKKVKKKRIYLGTDLDEAELEKKEKEADIELGILESLLTLEQLEILAEVKKRYQGQPRENFDNRYEAFTTNFTHDSTAIEGNTLTLQETSLLLFDGIAPSSKHLREINEVLNHKQAFDHILSYNGKLNRKLIMELHELVVKDTLPREYDEQIGRFRTVQVWVRGSPWMPPAPEDVPVDMQTLLAWYTKNKKRLHPVVLASYFHIGFETVHPFIDGNGRVGRLLLNFILHRNEYPMLDIPQGRRNDYYDTLESAQVDGDLRPFLCLVVELLSTSKLLF